MRVPAWLLTFSLLLACVTPDDAPELSSTEQSATMWQGEIRTLVLVAEFVQDVPHSTLLTWVDDQMKEFDTYIRTASYERAWINHTVMGPYLLSTNGCQMPPGPAFNDEKILRDTALLADPSIDFSQIDLVIVLSKDNHLCTPGNSGSMPNSPIPLSIPTNEPITGGWLRMRLQPPDPSVSRTYAHEFGHVMGVAHISTLRCTAANGSRITLPHSAAQGSCITDMDHLANSEPLNGRYSHYSAAYKNVFGWLDPAEVISSRSGVYTLTPLTTAGGIKLIEVPLLNSQYASYTLEYRQPVGYDATPDPYGPTPLSGVFMHVKHVASPGYGILDAPDLPPFESGPIALTALPLAQPRPGGGYEPSYVDRAQDIAIYVFSMSSSGAVVGVYPSTNWARYNNGGVVYAPSQWSTNHAKSMANNGTRTAAWWGGWWQLGSAANVGGGCWSPSTWMYVGFNGLKTIHQIDVIGLQDNFTAQTEPYLGQQSNLYGLRHFHVQYWAPTFQWVDVPNGYITWNNQVWNRLTFPPVSTQYVRVWIECAMDNYARVVELEAYGW